jgi:arginyl-tRNA synthetase
VSFLSLDFLDSLTPLVTGGSIAAALGSLLASLLSFRGAKRGVQQAQVAVGELLAREVAPTIESRIAQLQRNLAASSKLIEEINAEFELQAATAERIKGEAQENRRLAALHEEEAEAVRLVVERTIEGAQSKAARIGVRQQWLFFLAGLLAAVPLAVLANFLFAWLTS